MSKATKKILTSRPFLAVLYHFIRAYSSTFRLTLVGEEAWKDLVRQNKRVILCTWHQQFFAVIRHFQSYRNYHPALMISKSTDGQIIAGVAERTGWHTVRGSSSRQGREALHEMIEWLKGPNIAGHILDGPRGPAGVIKPGIIRLAHAAQAAIVPFHVEADRAWYFNSWDRFMLPKPFSKVTLIFDTPRFLRPTQDGAVFERQRQDLEEHMLPWLSGSDMAS